MESWKLKADADHIGEFSGSDKTHVADTRRMNAVSQKDVDQWSDQESNAARYKTDAVAWWSRPDKLQDVGKRWDGWP